MRSEMHRTRSLAEALERGYNVRQPLISANFREHLASSAANASVQAVRQPGPEPARQLFAIPAPERQDPVATPAATPAAAANSIDPLEAVRHAMVKAGLDPRAVDLTITRDLVPYPGGGGYVNHLIVAQTADGRSERFDVATALRNPGLTAHEIGKYLYGMA